MPRGSEYCKGSAAVGGGRKTTDRDYQPQKRCVAFSVAAARPFPHRAMGGVRAAQVRAGTGAEVSVVPFRLMDPPPAQILPEIDI